MAEIDATVCGASVLILGTPGAQRCFPWFAAIDQAIVTNSLIATTADGQEKILHNGEMDSKCEPVFQFEQKNIVGEKIIEPFHGR